MSGDKYQEQADVIVDFLKSNGVEIPSNLYIPWAGLLRAAGYKGFAEGREEAFKEMAMLCNSKLGLISVVGIKRGECNDNQKAND